MNSSNFFYLVSLGFKNVWHHKVYAAATVITMSACIYLFGIFFIAMVNVNSAVSSMEKDVAISVFFEEGISPDRVEEIGNEIRSRPEVFKTVYMSEEDAWDTFQKSFLNGEELLGGIAPEDNPLEGCDSYEVYIGDIEQQESFVNYIVGVEGVRKVSHSVEGVKAFIRLKKQVNGIGAGCLVVIVMMSVLLIRSTLMVTVDSQKEKRKVMRLIGAREDFIRVPFVAEGLILGLAGTCIPILLLYGTYVYGLHFVDQQFKVFGGQLMLLHPSRVIPQLVQASVCLGLFSGTAGSLLVMGKLKKK